MSVQSRVVFEERESVINKIFNLLPHDCKGSSEVVGQELLQGRLHLLFQLFTLLGRVLSLFISPLSLIGSFFVKLLKKVSVECLFIHILHHLLLLTQSLILLQLQVVLPLFPRVVSRPQASHAVSFPNHVFKASVNDVVIEVFAGIVFHCDVSQVEIWYLHDFFGLIRNVHSGKVALSLCILKRRVKVHVMNHVLSQLELH